MNTLFQKITAGIGLALSLSLTSCEKDSLFTPDSTGSARPGAVADDIVVSFLQFYRLTHHGDATLTYADNGRLLNVTTPARGNVSIQTDYTYSPGKIRAFTHQGNVTLNDETFTLDASGRCSESVVKGKYSDIHWIFNYENGWLQSIYNKNSCVGGVSFSYDTEGNMSLAKVSTGISESIDIAFAYNRLTAPALQDDKYPLTVSVPKLAAHDTYLRIFGKPSRNLLQRVTYTSSTGYPVPSDQFYTYDLNQEGYVTKKQQHSTPTRADVITTLYEYVASNSVLHP